MSGYNVIKVTKMSASQLANYVGQEGMIVVNTDTDAIHVLDGQKTGGFAIPNYDSVVNYVSNAVGSIALSGGQIVPTNITTAGHALTWNGASFQQSAEFVTKTDHANDLALKLDVSLIPGPSATNQALRINALGGIENFYLPTGSGGSGGSGAMPPPAQSQSHQVVVFDGTDFQNSDNFALKSYVDGSKSSLIAGATTYTNFSLVESAINSNITAIQNIQSSLTNTHADKNYVDTKVNALEFKLVGGAGSALDTLQEIESFILNNRSDIDTVLTNIQTKVNKLPIGVATPADHVLQWDGHNLVEVDGFAAEADVIALQAKMPANVTQAGEKVVWTGTGFQNVAETTTTVTAGSFVSPNTSTPDNMVVAWDATLSEFYNKAGYAMTADLDGIKPSNGDSAANESLIWSGGRLVNTDRFAPKTAIDAMKPSAATQPDQVLSWDGGQYVNKSGFARIVDDLQAIYPSNPSQSGESIVWDGSKFENTADFLLEADFTAAMPPVTTSGDCVKWNGTAFENTTLSSVGFTTTGAVTPPTASNSTDVMQWDGSNFINQPGFATQAWVNAQIGTLATAPPVQPNAGEFLYFDGTNFQYGTPTGGGSGTATNVPAAPTGVNEAVAWDQANSTFINVADYARTRSLSVSAGDELLQWNGTDLVNVGGWAKTNDVTTALAGKIDKPSGDTPAGQFLYWQGGALVSAAPTSGGSAITTPSVTTQPNEAVYWDQALGAFKNEGGYAMLTDLANFTSKPATTATSSSNQFLYWDGTNLVHGSPAASGGSSYTPPSAPTQPNEAVTWDGSSYVNTGGYAMLSDLSNYTTTLDLINNYASKGDISSLANKPTVTLGAAEVFDYDNANSIWTKKTIPFTPNPGTSYTTDDQHLAWTAAGLVSKTGFAKIGTASVGYRNCVDIEAAIKAKADNPSVFTSTNEAIQFISGTGWTKTTFAIPSDITQAKNDLIGTADGSHNTLGLLQNAISQRAPIPTSAEDTGTGEMLGWDDTAKKFVKKTVSFAGSAFNVTETNLNVVYTPNYSVIGQAVGIFDIVDNGTEYVIRPKATVVSP